MLDVWTHNQPEHTQDPVVYISLTLHTNTHRNKHTGTAEGPVSEKLFPPDWVSSQVKPWTVPTDTKEPRSLVPDCSDMDPVMSPLIQPSTSVSTVSLSSDVYYAKPISSRTLLGDSSSCKAKTKKLRFQCTSKLLNLKKVHTYTALTQQCYPAAEEKGWRRWPIATFDSQKVYKGVDKIVGTPPFKKDKPTILTVISWNLLIHKYECSEN